MPFATARLPAELYTAAEVREFDRRAIEDHGIPGIDLMERAGEACYRAARARWPEVRRWSVLCGPGNNGGDGYVVARLAHRDGLDVNLVQMGDADRLSGAALQARQAAQGAGLHDQPWASGMLAGVGLVIDGLFGTGLDREVAGTARQAIAEINACPAAVLAIDIPSGIHADSGAVLGAAVRADLTVTFIGLKRGLLTGAAPACTGTLLYHDLDVPQAVFANLQAGATRATAAGFADALPPRPRDLHKGQAGHVLIIGGDAGFSGALRLAGEAAARSGAGLVSIATRAAHAAMLSTGRPELMCHGVESIGELDRLIEQTDVVAIGPGLGRSTWARALFNRVLDGRARLVVDADALNLLAEAPVARPDWVLTPHPGEAARLLGTSAGEVQADRFGALDRLADGYADSIVLKGAGSLVRAAGQTYVCDAGNPGMASGGMGDVLTGIIAALMAQGFDDGEAALRGACLHARTADLAAAHGGQRGLLAGDVLACLRRVINAG